MKKGNKHTLQLIVAVLLVVFGVSLLTIGFIVPPLGVIDSSVLVAYGETLTFAGSVIGIDYSYKFRNSKRKSENENEDEE